MKRPKPPRAQEEALSQGEIQALYSIPELALLAKTSRFRMARLLTTHKVTFLRAGRSVLVPVSEIRWKVPELLEAILNAAELEEMLKSK